jgi:hypothetical protein
MGPNAVYLRLYSLISAEQTLKNALWSLLRMEILLYHVLHPITCGLIPAIKRVVHRKLHRSLHSSSQARLRFSSRASIHANVRYTYAYLHIYLIFTYNQCDFAYWFQHYDGAKTLYMTVVFSAMRLRQYGTHRRAHWLMNFNQINWLLLIVISRFTFTKKIIFIVGHVKPAISSNLFIIECVWLTCRITRRLIQYNTISASRQDSNAVPTPHILGSYSLICRPALNRDSFHRHLKHISSKFYRSYPPQFFY